MPTAEEIAAAAKADEEKKRAEEADKALEERIAKIANSAVSSQIKRIKPGVSAEDLEKLLDDREKKKAELDEEKRKKAAGEQNQPEIAKLTKEIEELRKKANAAEEKSAAQEKKQKLADDNATIVKTLEAAGVPAGQRARVALNHLRSEGMVKTTEAGELVFAGEEGEEDLAKGITAFLKSEEGKLFLPPSGAGGGGERRGRDGGGGGGNGKKSSKEKAGEALRAHRSGSPE